MNNRDDELAQGVRPIKHTRGFWAAMEFILAWEVGPNWRDNDDGGFNVDTGGATKWGISSRAHPDIDIKNMSLQDAREIYHRDYWFRWKCHLLRWPLSLVHFDTCVNIGNESRRRSSSDRELGDEVIRHYRANKMLQRALRVYVDGLIGNLTIGTAHRTDNVNTSLALLALRDLHYTDLAANNPDPYAKYLRGWLRRTMALRELVLSD